MKTGFLYKVMHHHTVHRSALNQGFNKTHEWFPSLPDYYLKRIKEADRKCTERYYLQSTKDSKSNQTVCCKIQSGQRKRWPKYNNDLRVYLSNFKFLILSVVTFNMKTFCEH